MAATAERTTIATTGLTKRYDDIVALDDVSLEIAEGAIGLLGANGAGKSTLMRALLGLVEPDAGTARLLGIDAVARGLELRRRIGYMPEHECLPSWMTARDLVVHLGELRGLPRRIAVLRTSEVLFQVGLEEERLRLIGTFSTGMRQRVKLAQALVHSPELVVLDEPTNGLDPQGRDEMLELVRRLSRDLGIRVLFSSHVLEDVERTCDAVVVLRDGRVAAQGRISDLRGREAGSARLSAVGNLRRAARCAECARRARRGRRGGLAGRPRRSGAALRCRARRLRRGRRQPARAAARRPHARGRRDRGDRMSARLEDTRYARYDGVRRPPWFAVVSLARWSAFGALGARKSWRAKFLPITLTLIAALPAFAVLAIRAIIGQRFADRFPELIPYRQYLTEIGLDITIFAAILCPELLCPDRRDNVLSLYLSTAVGRFTYVVGKFLAALVPLLSLTLLPVLLLFVGNTFFADSALELPGRSLARLAAHRRLGAAAGVVRQPGGARGRVVHEPARLRARRLRGAHADPDVRRRARSSTTPASIATCS